VRLPGDARLRPRHVSQRLPPFKPASTLNCSFHHIRSCCRNEEIGQVCSCLRAGRSQMSSSKNLTEPYSEQRHRIKRANNRRRSGSQPVSSRYYQHMPAPMSIPPSGRSGTGQTIQRPGTADGMDGPQSSLGQAQMGQKRAWLKEKWEKVSKSPRQGPADEVDAQRPMPTTIGDDVPHQYGAGRSADPGRFMPGKKDWQDEQKLAAATYMEKSGSPGRSAFAPVTMAVSSNGQGGPAIPGPRYGTGSGWHGDASMLGQSGPAPRQDGVEEPRRLENWLETGANTPTHSENIASSKVLPEIPLDLESRGQKDEQERVQRTLEGLRQHVKELEEANKALKQENHDLISAVERKDGVIEERDQELRVMRPKRIVEQDGMLARLRANAAEAVSKKVDFAGGQSHLRRPESEIVKSWQALAYQVRNFVGNYLKEPSERRMHEWIDMHPTVAELSLSYRQLALDRKMSKWLLEAAIWETLCTLVFDRSDLSGKPCWAGRHGAKTAKLGESWM
jgi:hypothetical protein